MEDLGKDVFSVLASLLPARGLANLSSVSSNQQKMVKESKRAWAARLNEEYPTVDPGTDPMKVYSEGPDWNATPTMSSSVYDTSENYYLKIYPRYDMICDHDTEFGTMVGTIRNGVLYPYNVVSYEPSRVHDVKPSSTGPVFMFSQGIGSNITSIFHWYTAPGQHEEFKINLPHSETGEQLFMGKIFQPMEYPFIAAILYDRDVMSEVEDVPYRMHVGIINLKTGHLDVLFKEIIDVGEWDPEELESYEGTDIVVHNRNVYVKYELEVYGLVYGDIFVSMKIPEYSTGDTIIVEETIPIGEELFEHMKSGISTNLKRSNRSVDVRNQVSTVQLPDSKVPQTDSVFMLPDIGELKACDVFDYVQAVGRTRVFSIDTAEARSLLNIWDFGPQPGTLTTDEKFQVWSLNPESKDNKYAIFDATMLVLPILLQRKFTATIDSHMTKIMRKYNKNGYTVVVLAPHVRENMPWLSAGAWGKYMVSQGITNAISVTPRSRVDVDPEDYLLMWRKFVEATGSRVIDEIFLAINDNEDMEAEFASVVGVKVVERSEFK
jgi:hypothetical protein